MLTSTHWGVYQVHLHQGEITHLSGFGPDPDPSPIGYAMAKAVTGPLRIRQPAIRKSYLEQGPGAARQKRGAEAFVPVSWNEALDLTAKELNRVRSAHGNESIFAGSYGWSSAGRFHHAQSQVHRFMNCLGGYVAHLGTYSLGAARTLLPRILMDMDHMRAQQTAWVSLEKHCQLVVSFGGIPYKNTQVNSGGISQHETRPMLKKLAAAGVQFVNISPLRGDMESGLNAQWIAPRPNTDTALMLGIAHTLVSRNQQDQAFLDRYCTDFTPLREYLLGTHDGTPKSAEWAATLCDIPVETILTLTERMRTHRTLINIAWSLQRADHGEQPYWMGIALACLLGQVGTPGGGFALAYGPVGIEGANAHAFSGPIFPQGQNPIKNAIPVARITDMLENPGGHYDFNGKACTYPDIKLIYWAGGNPFHHHQDLNRLIRSWRKKPETIIVNEQYWNANAKFADIVLPATTMLERNDIGSSGRDRFMIAMKKAIAPVAEARNDYDIFSALAERLGVSEAFTEGRDEMGWLRHLYDKSVIRAQTFDIRLPAFDQFWSNDFVEMPIPAKPSVMMSDFRTNPLTHPLPTPSGKIEISSSTIASFHYTDCPGHPVWLEPAEWLGHDLTKTFPLHLISHQPLNKLHSQYDHADLSRSAKVHQREVLTLNPLDAHSRGLQSADVVKIFNDRGACLASIAIDEGVRQGVALLPTGSWYDPIDPNADQPLEKQGNPNVLTLDKGTSSLTQGCSAHTTLVQVERFNDPLPPITAFDLPIFVDRETKI